MSFEEEKASPSSWKWIKAQSNNWGHRPEHRFDFAGTVAIRDGAPRNRRAIAGGVTGVHLSRLLENLNGGLGYVLQKRIQLLQRVGSDVQILKKREMNSANTLRLTLFELCLIMSCSSREDCLMVHWSMFCKQKNRQYGKNAIKAIKAELKSPSWMLIARVHSPWRWKPIQNNELLRDPYKIINGLKAKGCEINN